MDLSPLTLDGTRVRLDPMSLDHLDELSAAGAFDDLWKWTRTRATTRESMREYMEAAMAEAAQGVAMPFVTVDKASSRIVGSTRFGNIDPFNRRVEIGWTWITPEFQRSYVNSEAKYLMLRQAFEVWDCVRVELKTDVLNSKSREAMRRLGATEEGVFRKHMLAYGGRFRDSICFSILDTEWPAVKQKLESSLWPD
ncbi:MAG: GNAT family N-acetyltransferase [Gemmatimonadota bacterium]|nr:GNAT family N-acetyltransferase [Gemmatimonadota bacterium]